jgi:hypothetical protein
MGTNSDNIGINSGSYKAPSSIGKEEKQKKNFLV